MPDVAVVRVTKTAAILTVLSMAALGLGVELLGWRPEDLPRGV